MPGENAADDEYGKVEERINRKVTDAFGCKYITILIIKSFYPQSATFINHKERSHAEGLPGTSLADRQKIIPAAVLFVGDHILMA